MNTNVNPAEIEKFNDLAHRWWGEPGLSRAARQLAPVSARPRMAGLAPRTMDGFVEAVA
jgi:hypothetical protein